jgi:hypothetical protein
MQVHKIARLTTFGQRETSASAFCASMRGTSNKEKSNASSHKVAPRLCWPVPLRSWHALSLRQRRQNPAQK